MPSLCLQEAAFDFGGSVVIVDTDFDLPRYRFDLPGGGVILSKSVAVLPNSDLLNVLSGPGERSVRSESGDLNGASRGAIARWHLLAPVGAESLISP
jgi:hypothetical protein